MTESEAIKKHIDECNNRIENISFFMDSNSDANKEECCNNIEILQNVINALEKQIAKKPIFANNMMTKDKFLMCPCCEFRFPDSLVFLKTRCWNCGQKLDWSDEE